MAASGSGRTGSAGPPRTGRQGATASRPEREGTTAEHPEREAEAAERSDVAASGPPPRILIAGGGTGGHLYPALNLAAALWRASPGVRLLLLGARRGLEARVLPRTDWPYRLLPLEPLRRDRPWRNWRLLWTAPRVAAGLIRTFRDLDPQLVVGTGGYAAGPALFWGWLTRRRTAIQEQNAEPGLVSRLMAGRVDQLHLGYPEAAERLQIGEETEVFRFGNPVDPALGRLAKADPGDRVARPVLDHAKPGRVVLVAGGSQGARGLNERLLADLEAASSWPEDIRLVWIAGPTHHETVAARAARLPWADRIDVVPYVENLSRKLSAVRLAIARSGAMFVAELATAGVPAIFVPFPAAAGGHQSANARAMAEVGAAVVREEAELWPGELWELAEGILADEERRRSMAEAARARGAPDAADRIAAELLRLVAR